MNDEFKEKTIRKLIIENMFLLERIGKAINYIQSFDTINIDRELLIECIDKTLDILKGSDNECYL